MNDYRYAMHYFRHGGEYIEYIEYDDDIEDLVRSSVTSKAEGEQSTAGFYEAIDGEWVQLDVSDLIAKCERDDDRLYDEWRQAEVDRPWNVWIFGPNNVDTLHSRQEDDMASSTYTVDGDTLEVIVEQIEVTSNLPRWDPAWRHTDSHGHEHRYMGNRGGLPTLTYIVDTEDYVIDEDGYPEEYPGTGHYECLECGDHVSPGMRGPSPFREYMTGSVTYLLNGEPITREQAEAWRADHA